MKFAYEAPLGTLDSFFNYLVRKLLSTASEITNFF